MITPGVEIGLKW